MKKLPITIIALFCLGIYHIFMFSGLTIFLITNTLHLLEVLKLTYYSSIVLEYIKWSLILGAWISLSLSSYIMIYNIYFKDDSI